ncbi:MAG: hypothetical protein QOD42_3006 [Sphingomonadales bacterium]|jgi:hypothetical protein|nr:hypothetical protein [Sphingomonadales bacterium]
MKRLIILAPAIALAGIAAGCSKGADQLQPGQWEMVTRVKSIEIPGAPPEAQAQLRSGVGRSQTNQDCITPERARNPLAQMRQMMSQGQAANCRFTDEVFGGGVIRIRATCPGPGGQASGGGTVSLEGSFTATTLQATLSVNATGGSPAVPGATGMNMSAEINGRRVGECAAGARPGNGQ